MINIPVCKKHYIIEREHIAWLVGYSSWSVMSALLSAIIALLFTQLEKPHKAVRNELKFRQIQIWEMRKPDTKIIRLFGPLHPPRHIPTDCCCHPFPTWDADGSCISVCMASEPILARMIIGNLLAPKHHGLLTIVFYINTILRLWGAATLFWDKSLQLLGKNCLGGIKISFYFHGNSHNLDLPRKPGEPLSFV